MSARLLVSRFASVIARAALPGLGASLLCTLVACGAATDGSDASEESATGSAASGQSLEGDRGDGGDRSDAGGPEGGDVGNSVFLDPVTPVSAPPSSVAPRAARD